MGNSIIIVTKVTFCICSKSKRKMSPKPLLFWMFQLTLHLITCKIVNFLCTAVTQKNSWGVRNTNRVAQKCSRYSVHQIKWIWIVLLCHSKCLAFQSQIKFLSEKLHSTIKKSFSHNNFSALRWKFHFQQARFNLEKNERNPFQCLNDLQLFETIVMWLSSQDVLETFG